MERAIAILGGTGGLGEAIVRRLAVSAAVSIGYHSNREKSDALAASVARGAACAVDVRDGASVAGFLADARATWGRLDAIICATGPAIPLCALADVDEIDFRRIIETDVIGAFHVLKHGTQMLAESGGGTIVLLLTTAVLRTLENDGMSGIPKTAVAGLLRQAAREAGARNVRCNGIAPGVIDAGIVHASFEVDDTAKQVIENCLARTPMSRMGKPDEVAALAEFLVSEEAAYINGQIIAVDGGYAA